MARQCTSLTFNEAVWLFDYNPLTGILTWRVVDGWPKPIAKAFTGKEVGYRTASGARYVDIRGHGKIAVHRVIWLLVTGALPEGELDHKDCDAGNNKWENLRSASRVQNQANVRRRRNNKTGLKGVHLHKKTGKWRAQIGTGDDRSHLGLFDCPAAAHFAYVVSLSGRAGPFARFS